MGMSMRLYATVIIYSPVSSPSLVDYLIFHYKDTSPVEYLLKWTTLRAIVLVYANICHICETFFATLTAEL